MVCTAFNSTKSITAFSSDKVLPKIEALTFSNDPEIMCSSSSDDLGSIPFANGRGTETTNSFGFAVFTTFELLSEFTL